jgi:phage terminase large subunit-like protein
VTVIDEAFSQVDDRMEQALIPAQATRRAAQFLVVSNAGTPYGSPYLLPRVEQGRLLAEAGLTDTSCYVEYSAAADADPADPATWAGCNPAMGQTITESAIDAEYASMDLVEFKRARLCQWTSQIVPPVVPLDTWSALTDLRAAAPDRICAAFDVGPERARASVAVAGRRPDGKFFVELVYNLPGTEWVPSHLADLVEKYHPQAVLCDPIGGAGSLIPELVERRVDVTKVSAQEHAQACGRWFDLVVQGNLVHRGQRELLSALDGAVKRSLGDAWAWSRKSSSVDISPLVAATIALWGAQAADTKPEVWSMRETEAWRNAHGQPAERPPVADVTPQPAPTATAQFTPLSAMPYYGITSVAHVVAQNEPPDIRVPNYPREEPVPNDD